MKTEHASSRLRRLALVAFVVMLSATFAVAATAGGQAVGGGGYKLAGTWGKVGTANGQFSTGGGGLAVDRAGNVYVADSDNNRVQVFSAKGAFLRKWGSTGAGDGQFGRADDVAVAPDGTIWVADDPNGRYQAFSSGGAFKASVSAPTGELARGVAVDGDGNVLGAVEGSSQSGFRVFRKGAGGWDPPAAMQAVMKLFRADDVEASPDGSVYMVRSGTQGGGDFLQRYSASGKLLRSTKLTSGDGTRALAVDLDCNVLASDGGPAAGFAKYSPSGKKLASGTLPYIANDLAVGPTGDLYAKIQSQGIARLVEDRSKPATAVIAGAVRVSGGVARVKYTLSGVACPAQVPGTASLAGSGLSGKASVKVASGKTTVLSIPVKGSGASSAQFKIVLRTNGRPTIQTATVKVK